MATVTVRNIPDNVHRALKLLAAEHGRSTEAEIRWILQQAAQPPERIKLGSLLAAHAQKAGTLTDAEVDQINRLRDKTPAKPPVFE